MSLEANQKSLPFELYDCLYNHEDSELISNDWVKQCSGNKYSRLVFILISFLNGRSAEESLSDFHIEQNISEVYHICKYELFSVNHSNDKYLSDIFSKLKLSFGDGLNSNSIGVSELMSIINLSQVHEKYVVYLIFWVVIRFFDAVNANEHDITFDQVISNCLNLAYNIDHVIWDLVVSDYIMSLRERGVIEINSVLIELNDETESLFFIHINPYSICPTLCCLLLILTSKISSNMSSVKTDELVQSAINNIIISIKNTLREVSPDMAEVSFTITVCRMISNISFKISSELMKQLLSLKNSQKTKTSNSKSINMSFIDRFILYSFVSVEQLWLELSNDEQFFSSIINHIPSLELSISLLSLMGLGKGFTNFIAVLIIIFSLNNQFAITGHVNKNAVEIMRKLVVISDEPIGIILKYFMFSSDTKKSSSEITICSLFNLLSDNVHNASVSLSLVKSIVNLIQINYFSLSDVFLYSYLDSFPRLVKFFNEKENMTRINSAKRPSLLNCISSNGCIFIDEMYWCNSNLIQLLLTGIDIEFEHILRFVYSISLSITNIQYIVNNKQLYKCGYLNIECLNVSSGEDDFKISNINRSNINKSIKFILKTNNIDMIVITILNYLADWIKINNKLISLELLLKQSKLSNSETVNNGYTQGYFSMFLVYLFYITEKDKSSKKFTTIDFHIIPWRGTLRWIEYWEGVFLKSVLNPRTWKVIFLEIIAIMSPESFIIPSVPNSSSKIQSKYFSWDIVNILEKKIKNWLNDRKISFESLKKEELFLENIDSILIWLEMFYFEPNTTVYFTLENIFKNESTYVKECNFQELYFEICSTEIKLKEFISNPDIYIKKFSNYLPDENSIEILGNISSVLLYFHDSIKFKAPIISPSQNTNFDIFCIIWNKYANYYRLDNQLTTKQFMIYFSNFISRDVNIIKQIIEQGFQYKNITSCTNIDIYLENTSSLLDIICFSAPQVLTDNNIVSSIANILDNILCSKLVIDLWGKYDITNNEVFGQDFQIENQLIHCVLLLSWISTIILPRKPAYKSKNNPEDRTQFLPFAERSVVNILCIAQDIVNSHSDSKYYHNLIINFNILLVHSTHFIISVSETFSQLNKALKDILTALKQLMSGNSLLNSSIYHTICTIDEKI